MTGLQRGNLAGPQVLCTVNLVAQAVGCALLPAAAAAGPAWLSAVYALNGVFQGSRVPCVQVLQQRWIPDGIERVRHQQVTSWANQVGAPARIIISDGLAWQLLQPANRER